MKRIFIMLLIACSATIVTNAQQKGKASTVPYNVKTLFNTIIKNWGNPSGEVYSVQRNPNTNQIESSVKITHFVANIKSGTPQLNIYGIAEAFMKDEPVGYQVLHISPGEKETFSLEAINENERSSRLFRVRLGINEEMWLLCAKNPDNPKLRDAYAINWTLNDDKSKALGAIYQITSLRPDMYGKSMSGPGIMSDNKQTFAIDGRVGWDLTDSLYVVYMADSAEELNNIDDSAFVAYMPVVNKRFSFSVQLDKPKVGRIRTVMPDGSLCKLWTNLDFVPGETYQITTHNGYYDEDRDYEQRVGRYSGKSLLNRMQVQGIDDIHINPVPAIDGNVNAKAPLQHLSDAEKNTFMMIGSAIEMNIELIKSTYEAIGAQMNGMRDSYIIEQTFGIILKQNKELDKKYADIIKHAKKAGLPASDFPDLYKNILDFYTEQFEGLSRFYSEYGTITKNSKKLQQYLTKQSEKYMKEMGNILIKGKY